MISLKKLEKFMRLLHAVQNTERVARVPDETKLRNTAEHTFELAMVCWYLNSVNQLNLDSEKILKYALAHDIIEAYAGDTPIFDNKKQEDKKEREAKALKQLEKNFSEFPELISIIHNYENKNDEESRFVYSADKLVDPLNISMEKENSLFKEYKVSYTKLREYKDEKIAYSEHITHYWKILRKKFEKNKKFFFNE